jgi:multidrug efflux pump subunit AcrA (membrane-fusion protein)
MSRVARRAGAGLVAVAVAVGLVVLYLGHRLEGAEQAERDLPVVAPSRVSQDSTAVVVSLGPEERRRVGIELAALRAASSGGLDARLSGEVVPETERAAVLRAPVAGRFTVPEGGRWPALGERVAANVPLARVSDARALALPIGGVVTRIGAQPGSLVEAGQVLLEVADYTRPLVRMSWLDPTAAAPPARVSLGPGSASSTASVPARLVGPAPEADPVTRRPAYLYRAERAWPGAAPGTPVVGYTESPAAVPSRGSGVLVPDSAVVQWDGLAWAYLARPEDHFERVRVRTGRPARGGWIVDGPLAVGDSVVVRGAEELLSEEFRARVTVGDESGE